MLDQAVTASGQALNDGRDKLRMLAEGRATFQAGVMQGHIMPTLHALLQMFKPEALEKMKTEQVPHPSCPPAHLTRIRLQSSRLFCCSLCTRWCSPDEPD